MKSTAFFLGISLLAFLPLRAGLLVQPHDRVLVAAEVPLDQGMVSVDLAAYFLMCRPVDGLEVIGANEGEEEIEPFLRRIPTEIAAWSPTVALISHGGNDGRDGRDGQGFLTYHPLYIGQTLDALKKIGVRTIVLGSTSAVDSSVPQGAVPAGTYNENLAAFASEDRDIAAKAGVPFAAVFTDTFDTMNRAKARFGATYNFGGDSGRFLHRNAQLVMAYAFLKALGCDGAIGTITVDLAHNTATGTPGQKIVSQGSAGAGYTLDIKSSSSPTGPQESKTATSAQSGSVTVESTRYPYCFVGGPQYPGVDDTTRIIGCFPFNQDLNRYLLLVKGLTSARAKVTWGTESRAFASADLARGVNLAAAFAGHTPFDATFNRIVDVLWQQQLKQYIWTDSVLQHLPDLKKMAPGSDADFDQLIAGIHAQDNKNGAVARAMFVPIQHTIKIESLP